MKPLPKTIKAAAVLIFIDLVVLFDHIRLPYMVIMGVYFLEGPLPTTLALCAFLAMGVGGYLILKKNKRAMRNIQLLAIVFSINALANLVSSFIFGKDIAGLLERVAGSYSVAGFASVQAVFLATNILLWFTLKNARKV